MAQKEYMENGKLIQFTSKNGSVPAATLRIWAKGKIAERKAQKEAHDNKNAPKG